VKPVKEQLWNQHAALSSRVVGSIRHQVADAVWDQVGRQVNAQVLFTLRKQVKQNEKS